MKINGSSRISDTKVRAINEIQVLAQVRFTKIPDANTSVSLSWYFRVKIRAEKNSRMVGVLDGGLNTGIFSVGGSKMVVHPDLIEKGVAPSWLLYFVD